MTALLATLRPRFGDRVTDAVSVRAHHAQGEGFRDAHPPDLVAFPETTAEVADLVAACHAAGTPVIAFGAGTSLEGHVAAVRGGLCLDLSRMDRVLEVDAANLDVAVEAGCVRTRLNAALRPQGLIFPLDPGADATLGGMAATRASGTNAVRYGTMREAVLGLTVVTATGDVIRTGGRARKSSAGYDLTRLFIGSEGTLGIITELRLRVWGLPEAVAAAVCPFPSVEAAVATVVAALQMGIPVARIELLDALQMRACIAHARLTDLDPVPTLFLECHGGPAAVAEQMAGLRALAEEEGGGPFREATRPEDRTRLWQARHDAYWAARALAPGCDAFATDACVPIAALPAAIARAQALAAESGLLCPIVGHVGDGNFHLLVLFDPADASARARAERVATGVAEIALALGGTCTGEHGIGLHKRDLLAREAGPALEVMRAIKAALDPRGILNPGKIL